MTADNVQTATEPELDNLEQCYVPLQEYLDLLQKFYDLEEQLKPDVKTTHNPFDGDAAYGYYHG